MELAQVNLLSNQEDAMLLSLIVMVVLCVIGAILYFVSEDKGGRYGREVNAKQEVGATMFWIPFIVLCVSGLIWLFSYPGSVNTIGELEAFKESVYETYVSAVDMTTEATIKLNNMDKAMFSAENLKQSSNISDRIKELRDKVEWYNSTVFRYRQKNKTWWADPFIADCPETLTPIKLVLSIK